MRNLKWLDQPVDQLVEATNYVHDFFMYLNSYFENSMAWEIWPDSPDGPGNADIQPGDTKLNHYWVKWINKNVDKNPLYFWNSLDYENKMKLIDYYRRNPKTPVDYRWNA